MTVQEAMEQYALALGKGDGPVVAKDLAPFADFVGLTLDVERLTIYQVNDWFDVLRERHFKKRQMQMQARAFLKWLVAKGHVPEDALYLIPGRDIEDLSEKAVRSIIAWFNRFGADGSGLRPSHEYLALVVPMALTMPVPLENLLAAQLNDSGAIEVPWIDVREGETFLLVEVMRDFSTFSNARSWYLRSVRPKYAAESERVFFDNSGEAVTVGRFLQQA